MCKHEAKVCPRCRAGFECKVGDVSKCQCYQVKLTDADRDFLAKRYADCLCAECMREVATAYRQAQAELRLKQVFGSR